MPPVTPPVIFYPNGAVMGTQVFIVNATNEPIPWDGAVSVSVSSSGSAIEDGVTATIKATVIDGIGGTGVANPLAVSLYDSDGNPLAGSAVSLADGADVAEGATTDVAVTGDNSGTVSAKLRGINKILADVWDSINSRLTVFVDNATLAVTQSGSWVLSAGAAIIGQVGIDQTTPGTTNGVVVNSSALPTGAATAANQSTQITAEQAIQAAVEIIDDWDESDRAKVNPVVGQAGLAAGTGIDALNALRVSLATDIPLPTGTNSIGQVTANAGTNLNTSALALESGGNLAAAVTALQIIDDWDESDRAKVNPISGQVGVAGGSGVVGATTQRVVLATDVGLPAGTNALGTVRTGKEPALANYWDAQDVPAANTQATVTKAAAGIGISNVCTGFTVTLASTGSAPSAVQLTVALIDGATATTTYLWRSVIALPAVAGAIVSFTRSGLWHVGTANTAMTLEFSAAGGANTIESVSMEGTVL